MRPSPLSHNVTTTYKRIAYELKPEKQSILDFKPMTVNSVAEIAQFMHRNLWHTCDYTIGGMLMWSDYFDYQYCIYKDTLFVKGISENHPGVPAFSLPLGALSLNEAVEVIARYCEHTGTKMTFSAIPVEVASELVEIIGGTLEPLDGWSDYLYVASSLASLTGKSYSKKRNHVNRFMSDNPDYRFELISANNIEDARDFMTKVDVSEKADPDMASYELQQSVDVIDHLDDYLFEGALLRAQSGKVCAVTFGEVVGNTLFVHIEKMDHEVAGAGETINKLFAAAMIDRHSEIQFINREEDMNDPGLRYAKESYHPTAILDKCNVIA